MNRLDVDPITMALHELRGPLALMANAARLAADECDDTEARHRCEVILRTSERLLATAQQVVTLAQAGREAEARPFDPLQTALAVLADYSSLGVPVRLEIAEPPPELTMTGVPERFEALVSSLLSNAVDHRSLHDPVVVLVTREGPSLNIALSNHVSTLPRHAGLGIGAYISDQLAEMTPATVIRENRNGCYVATISVVVDACRAVSTTLAS